MNLVKIALAYENQDGYSKESVWATSVGPHYRIENIPFFATSIAYGDIVSAQENDGELLVDGLIEASGHSVVQIILFDEQDVDAITTELVRLGCTWETSHLPTYLAVDVPATVDYQPIKKFLEEQAAAEVLGYREACLGFL